MTPHHHSWTTSNSDEDDWPSAAEAEADAKRGWPAPSTPESTAISGDDDPWIVTSD